MYSHYNLKYEQIVNARFYEGVSDEESCQNLTDHAALKHSQSKINSADTIKIVYNTSVL